MLGRIDDGGGLRWVQGGYYHTGGVTRNPGGVLAHTCALHLLSDAMQLTRGYHVYRTDAIAMRGSDGVTLDAVGVLSHVEGVQVGWLTGNNPLTSGVITCKDVPV